MNADQISGCILGTAVGDALGLPYEGLPPRRAAKLLGPPDRHRFFFGRGMVSDDTEHCWMTAQALVVAGGDVALFRRDLARRLRWWLLGAPAGIGLATLRAIGKLWLGWSPQTSGVYSAGNGPVMRAAILGIALEDERLLREFVLASTRITHTDPKAERAALAVAFAARMNGELALINGRTFLARLHKFCDPADEDWLTLLSRVVTAVESGQSTEDFAKSLGLERGVTGYVEHTVPVVLHAWLRSAHDFREAISSVIRCGGDTDTTAAILGGILGASGRRDAVPADWIANLATWPSNEGNLSQLAAQVATGASTAPITLNPAAILLRNLFFAAVVLSHGLRRLLPPW